MSQITQPQVPLAPSLHSSRRGVWIGLVVALAIAAGLVVALVLSDGSTTSTPSGSATHLAARPDGGPSESAVAASVGSRPTAAPSESSVAASIRSAPYRPASGPDESRVAASIAGR